ncbi:MAG: DUF2177 family protein [Aquabacterium sp.]|nr:MAG: DUF2177 family protein [Aquabacterium sp.]TAL20758.1 MAG: DUF2177 family protein [Aquabacterium sp.]
MKDPSSFAWSWQQGTAAYVAALLVVGLLDALWLGWLMRDFYRREFGDLMAPSVRMLPALLFYLGYPLGILALSLHPQPSTMAEAAWRGAALGLVAYGVYDLTNLATLRGWSLRLAMVDVLWGVAVSCAAATAAWLALVRLAR